MNVLTMVIVAIVALIIIFLLFKIASVVMRVVFVIILVLVAVFLFRQYNADETPSVDVPLVPDDVSVPLEEANCEAMGGVYGPQGKGQQIFCNLPTSDGGKPCSDASQCERLCIVNATTMQGQCQSYKNVFGCMDTLSNGTVATVCID